MRTEKKRGRWVAAAAGVLIGTLLLTACGRAETQTTVSAAPVDNGPATGRIDVWTAGDLGSQTKPMFEAFKAANQGVTVTVTDVPWTEIDNKMQNATAAGTVPDLVLIGETTPLIAANALQPLPEGIVKVADLDATALGRTKNPAGTQFAVPWYVETRVLFSHKAAVEKAGVKLPTTWDEQLDYFGKIQALDNVTEAVALPVAGDQPHQLLLSYLAQAGGSPMTADKKAWNFDTPEMTKALTYYGEFFKRGLASPNGYGDNLLPSFLSGATDSMIQGVYLVPAVDSAMKDQGLGTNWSAENLVAGVLPAGSAGNASYLGGANWVVPAASDNGASAWKLVRWLMEPAQQLQLFSITRNIPATTSTWTDPSLTSDPWITTSLEQLKNTVSDPVAPTWREIAGFIDSESEKIVRGSVTPTEAAKAIQQHAEKTGLGW